MEATDPIHDLIAYNLASSSKLTTEQIASSESANYLRSLSTLSLSDLKLQPDLLRTKSQDLERQLSQLCITQKDAFISLHAAELSFAPALDSLSSNLDHLISSSLPELQNAASAFKDVSRPSLDERDRILNVMKQYEHGFLADLLDLPGLVDTCVRARHYPEAVQLGHHIASLTIAAYQDKSELRDGEVLVSLLHDTWAHLSKVKMQLISTFSRAGLKLPVAKRTASTLRKLNKLACSIEPLRSLPFLKALPDLRLDESQLCLCYLKARSRFFNDSLNRIVGAFIYVGSYLRKYIDAWREGMSDTLGIAVALFSESTDSGRPVPTPSYLVSAYSATALDRLMDTLQAYLPRLGWAQSVEDAATVLSGLHMQLSYASAALSRFGFEFGHILTMPRSRSPMGTSATSSLTNSGTVIKLGLLEGAWYDFLESSLTSTFHDAIKTIAFKSLSTAPRVDKRVVPSLPSTWLLDSSASLAEIANRPISSFEEISHKPSNDVIFFPLLAGMLNGILSSLNGLRVFAPLRIQSFLSSEMETGFERVRAALLAYAEQVEACEPHILVPASAVVEGLEDLNPEERRNMAMEKRKEQELALLVRLLTVLDKAVAQWSLDRLNGGVFGSEYTLVQSFTSEKASAWIQYTEAKSADAERKREDLVAERKAEAERKRAEEEAEEKRKEEKRARLEEEERVRQEEEVRKSKAVEDECRKKEEEEAKRLRLEEEARVKAEEEARLKAEQEAKMKAEEEARTKGEEEARLAKVKADDEARVQAEAKAKLKAEEDARVKAEKEAKLNKEQEDRAKQAEEAARMKKKEETRAQERLKKHAEEEEHAKKEEEERIAQEERQAQAEEERVADENERQEKDATEPKPQAEAQPSAASIKKTNLAEKLRLRKEQREREAAAAAAKATTLEAPTTQPVDKSEAQPEATESTEEQEAADDEAEEGNHAAEGEEETPSPADGGGGKKNKKK